jgi:hypothetical protein
MATPERRQRPKTLSRINYKQTLRVFLAIIVYRVIVGSLVTSLQKCGIVTFFLNCPVQLVLYLVLKLIRRWLSSGLLLRVVWYKFTDVSQVLSASIIRKIIALMMEAARTSGTQANFTRLHDSTTQNTAIFMELG